MNRDTAMAARTPYFRTGRAVMFLAAWWLMAVGFASTLCAEPPLPPKPTKYFNDYAAIVPADVGQRLNEKLAQFERDTSNQVLVAVFPQIPEGTYLEDYTIKTAQSWGTGQKKRDNGIILFAFIKDRKMRIEVGYGLEGAVPDTIAASIIRDVIRPQFKAGNYAAGFEQGVEAIIKATKHEYKGTGATVADGNQTSSSGTSFWVVIVLVVIFLIWCQMGDTLIQRGGRFVFWNLLDIIRVILVSLPRSGGSSSGWSSGSDSGGGSSSSDYSGGGGSFGGGGASGDW